MKRKTSVGGKRTVRKPRVQNPGSEARALATDVDAVDPESIDPKDLDFVQFELSHALRKQIQEQH